MESVAYFETGSAHRYLESLCQHFGRKVDVKCDSESGWAQFPFGRCDMTANAERLEIVATAEDADGLELLIDIVTRHLERYAFRENPRLDWQASSTAKTKPRTESS